MKLFVTGISTDVGKTIASAILTEALQADYWKPVQAGLEHADSDTMRSLVSNSKSVIHAESYRLFTPASPHLAAQIDNISIALREIIEPITENHLVIEGAGGLYVPLNSTDTIADLIKPDYKVVIVSRHYLGSINHTLLTVEALRHRKAHIAGIIFSGDENASTESIVIEKTGIVMIGRIENEPYFDKNVISDYADRFRSALLNIQP